MTQVLSAQMEKLKTKWKILNGKVKDYVDELDAALAENDLISGILVEAGPLEANLSRRSIVLGVFAVSLIWLRIGFWSSLLCNALCFVFPAYETLKALETRKGEDDYLPWLSYWIVYNTFYVLEYLMNYLIFFRMPWYNCVKFLFLVMCMYYRTANYVPAKLYHDVLRPWIQKEDSKRKALQFTAVDLEEMSIKDKSSKIQVYELKQFNPTLIETDGTKGMWIDAGSITLRVYSALYSFGGFRNVFIAALESNPEEKYVVKRYNLNVKHHILNRGGNLHAHAKMDVQRTTGVASIYAENFSRERGLEGSAELRYHPVYISMSEDLEPVFIEGFIAQDHKFLKYICNEGRLSKGTPPEEQKICEAFVHYTFEKSIGKHMLCDIQGWFPLLCDPEIATFKKSDKATHSLGDHSDFAIRNFSETHECLNLCQELGLTKLEKKGDQKHEQELLEQQKKEMKEQQEQVRLKAEEERIEKEMQELKMRAQSQDEDLMKKEKKNLEKLQRDKKKLEKEIEEMNRKKLESIEQLREQRVTQELVRLGIVLKEIEKRKKRRVCAIM